MGSYRDKRSAPTVINCTTLEVTGRDNGVYFDMLHGVGVSLDREGIITLVAELQSWLDVSAALPERQRLIKGTEYVTCPYCGRQWRTPKGRKAGFVLSGIYNHVEVCRFDQVDLG